VQGQAAQVEAAGGVRGLVRLYGQDGKFVGLGELQPGGRLLPKRLLATAKAAIGVATGNPQQIPKIA
jgi:hypothetical protein